MIYIYLSKNCKYRNIKKIGGSYEEYLSASKRRGKR